MVKQFKIDEVSSLKQKLEEKNNIILTHYSGVKVKDLGSLRRQLREKNAEYKVVKNNLFKRALSEAGYEIPDEMIKGPIGVTFLSEEVGEVAKLLKDFGKENAAFKLSVGVLDNVVYGEEDVRRIADLPSKEVLLSQTLSLINGPTSGIAMGMNQIMASLARGIQAVAEANN